MVTSAGVLSLEASSVDLGELLKAPLLTDAELEREIAPRSLTP